MKKKLLIALIVLISIFTFGFIEYKYCQYLKIKNAKIEVELNDDMTVEFNESKKISDYIESINGKIIDDALIDTSKVGFQIVDFYFINDDGIKVNYSYTIEVKDTVEPVIWLGSTYKVKKGNKFNVDSILCGDNYDNNPKCYVEGEYDTNKVGSYPLVFKAVDKSGNEAKQNFVLNVYEPKPSSSKNTTSNKTVESKTKFSDVYKKYKTNTTSIGIDVSSWQGDIDFAKLKQSGVEFIIIRVGGTRGTNGEYFLDNKFIQNIKGANEYEIPVGLYFYSYANSNEHAYRDAKWVLEQIKDYKVELPIAFDWEEWSSFNEYNLSFFELSSISETFLDTLSKEGYKGMLYSSKSYLDYIWYPTKYDVWLAHYTDKTTYKGKYNFWQMCDNGQIDGINGNVDIDIMYH